MRNKRQIMAIFILLLLLFCGLLLSFTTGPLAITLGDVFNTIIGRGTQAQHLTLFMIRLPRIVIAILVGAALAISGTILQAVMDNDLAEPGILGINSGAALFVVVYIFLSNGQNYFSMPQFTIFTMPLIAMVGGLFAAFLIYIFAWNNHNSTNRILLMGIAVNAAFSALIIVLQLSFNSSDFNRVLMWTTGSLWGTSWPYVYITAPIIIGLSIFTIYRSRYLDVLKLGDMTATGLGVRVQKEQGLLIIIAVILASTATAVAGSISFVGLMAPHIARRLVGPRHKHLTFTAALIGMVLVVIADIISRNLFSPVELFIGTVISILGVPYFIYLMLKD
jgi:iron complex transport system permease protein